MEKSEQIVAAYEDYLYFLNKEAFDEYWEARKNYDGEWDPVNDSYASRIEEKLGQRLQKSGIDFRVILNRVGDDVLSVQDISGLNRIELNMHFYNLVQTEHPLDLKSRTYNGGNYSIWSRLWDSNFTGDYAGNYLYGYVGSGLLYAPDIYLKGAAGAAQVLSDKDILKWLKNVFTGHFGDNKGDSKMIQDGLDAYHKKIKDYIEEHGELPSWVPVQRS